MKNIILVFFIIISLPACHQKDAEPVAGNNDTSVLAATKHDSVSIKTDAHYFWESSFEGKPNRMVMKRVRPLNNDSLTHENLVREINDQYADIKISFVRTSNDTIFVKINNSKLLARQMGSSGAESYMAEVTYNLTELPNVNFVGFIFKQGDHATPGVYSRTDFIHPPE